MRFIFGRFIDCFILWALTVFYTSKNSDNFWMALSANLYGGEYALRVIAVLFTDNFLSEVWGLYAKKAYQEFEEDVLGNYGDRQVEASKG